MDDTELASKVELLYNSWRLPELLELLKEDDPRKWGGVDSKERVIFFYYKSVALNYVKGSKAIQNYVKCHKKDITSESELKQVPLLAYLLALSYYYFSKNEYEKLKGLIDQAKEVLVTFTVESEKQRWELQVLNMRGHLHYSRNEWNVAIKYYQAVLSSKPSQSINLLVIAQRGIANCCYYLEKFDQAIECYEKSFSLLNNIGVTWDLSRDLSNIGNVLNDQKRYSEALNYLFRAKKMGEISKQPLFEGNATYRIGWTYVAQENVTEAMRYFEEGLIILQKHAGAEKIGSCLRGMGYAYHDMGRIDQALKCYTSAYEEYRQAKNIYWIQVVLNDIGMAYRELGEYKKALTWFNKVKNGKTPDWLELPIYRRTVLTNIADIYLRQGNVDEALRIQQELLAFYLDQPTIREKNIGWIHSEIGSSYRMKNDLEQATKHYELAYNYLRGEGPISLSLLLVKMIGLYSDLGEGTRTNHLLSQLKKLSNDSGNDLIHIRQLFGEALVLKGNSRLRTKLQAVPLLEKVLASEVAYASLRMNAIVSLCELNLLELKANPDLEVLAETKDHIRLLAGIAESQHAYPLLVHAYLLQSQIALVENSPQKIQPLIEKALTLTKKLELEQLEEKVHAAEHQFYEMIQNWMELTKGNQMLQDQIEKVNLFRYLEEAKRFLTDENLN